MSATGYKGRDRSFKTTDSFLSERSGLTNQSDDFRDYKNGQVCHKRAHIPMRYDEGGRDWHEAADRVLNTSPICYSQPRSHLQTGRFEVHHWG